MNQETNRQTQNRIHVVPVVVSFIRLGVVPDQKTNIPQIAKEAGLAVTEVERFYTGVKDNTVFPQIAATTGQTQAGSTQRSQQQGQSSDQQREFAQYEPIAQAFWKHFTKNNLIDAAKDKVDQIARAINVDRESLQQFFQTEGRTVGTQTAR